jgi:threonylcarbamoyladenosine tRNA methylthiotransferase MtaB
METVLGEVRTRLEEGLREVVLTGVDITSWGEDLDGAAAAPRLGDLVGAILAGAPELARLRLSSIDAAEIDGTLLRLFAEAPRLMPHLHLSLQAGDDLILKRMRRRHLRADALRLIDAVRRARPETAFGADLIAGFPTETEAMFQNTLSLIEEAGLAYVHVFPFSPRPGTPAARMPQLDRALVKERAERLRAAADAALARHLSHRLGRVLPTLVEGPGRGRAEDFTEILLPGGETPGALLDVRIEAVEGRRARGAPQDALAA